VMDRAAKVLLEKESIERAEFLQLIRGVRAPEGRGQRTYTNGDSSPFDSGDETPADENGPTTPETPDAPSGDATPKRPLPRPRLEPGMA
jgi:hypothetical protein